MRQSVADPESALTAATRQLLASGGKRIRPAIALMAGRILSADLDRLVAVASAIEMLHTATLVHDDLVDGAPLRRGIPTLNARWGPGAAVLTGDYLFARAADFAAQTDTARAMRVFTRTLIMLVKGEITQMFGGREANRARDDQRTRSPPSPGSRPSACSPAVKRHEQPAL